MPLYEYQCNVCDHRFELIQKFSDPPAETCPNCGGAVRKLLSSPAIQFKGNGWYITDYARKGAGDAKPEGKSQGDQASAAASGETKGAKSPEAKGGDAGGSSPAASGTTSKTS